MSFVRHFETHYLSHSDPLLKHIVLMQLNVDQQSSIPEYQNGHMFLIYLLNHVSK